MKKIFKTILSTLIILGAVIFGLSFSIFPIGPLFVGPLFQDIFGIAVQECSSGVFSLCSLTAFGFILTIITYLLLILIYVKVAKLVYFYLSTVSERRPNILSRQGVMLGTFIGVASFVILVTSLPAFVASKDAEFGCRLVFDGPGVANRSRCLSELAIRNSDSIVCDKVNEQYYRDGCNSHFGRKGGNPMFCSRIIEGYLRNQCFVETALINEDIMLCGYIIHSPEDIHSKEACIMQVAEKTKNKSLCDELDKLEKDEILDRCKYEATAVEDITTAECSAIQTLEVRNDCFLTMARRDKNPALCDYVSDSDAIYYNRTYCRNTVSKE